MIIGFGSIGKGVLPLLQRHLLYDESRMTVIDPNPAVATFLARHKVQHLQTALTSHNYRELLGNLFRDSHGGPGLCIHLAVNTSSLDLIRWCRRHRVLYIDTVVEPWAGFYLQLGDNGARTNYALRQAIRNEKARNPGGTTAVSCCGANPGMVSWFVKEALLKLSSDIGLAAPPPVDRAGWARLMQSLGIKGLHIAERDTQVRRVPRQLGMFVNTWSTAGFIAESIQPTELGWGTHERRFPANAHRHANGCEAAIWIELPGGMTRVHTWCPSLGPQFGFLISHNEAISISDYFTIGDPAAPTYRPTCLYAYHPCDDAILSLHEMFGSGRQQERHKIISADEIVEGGDELGVMLYGHKKNVLWYGSRLSNEEARSLAPYQNATGLQVTSAVLAGIVWALENPEAGIVETDEMDYARCLAIQRPYLGSVEAHYTNWTPLQCRGKQFAVDIDESDPWQFCNALVR